MHEVQNSHDKRLVGQLVLNFPLYLEVSFSLSWPLRVDLSLHCLSVRAKLALIYMLGMPIRHLSVPDSNHLICSFLGNDKNFYYLLLLCSPCERKERHKIKKLTKRNTVKVGDSPLSLSGFVSFFGGRICGGAYPRRIYSYILRAYFDKLTFLGGLSAGRAYLWGGRYHGCLRYILEIR